MNIYLNSALMTFLMVAISLALISLVLQGLKALALAVEKRAADAGEQDDQGVDTELAVVLAAAAHAVLGPGTRIRRIHLHHGTEDELWSRAGRVDIMHSHRVEPKR
jgi:hypothetical protein